MNEFLIKLQKNIFLITVVCSMLFGLALAYGGAVGVGFYLQNNLPERKPVARSSSNRLQRNIPDIEKYYEIVPGPFLRGAARVSQDSAAAPVPVAGEITVIGVTTGDRWSARALIQEKGKDADAVAIGQTIAGYQLVGVRQNYVSLKVGEQTVRINVGEKSGQATAPDSGTGGSAKPAVEQQGTIVKVNLSRARLKQMMEGKGMAEIRKTTKFSMKTRGGKVLGVKLAYLHPQKSPFAQLGAKQGDILRRFNGEKLDNQIKMLKLYESIQKLDKITLDVERSGKLMTFEVFIK